MSLGREEVVRQCCVYVNKNTDQFWETLKEYESQGYKGPFLICTDKLWSQLQSFAANKEKKWLVELVN